MFDFQYLIAISEGNNFHFQFVNLKARVGFQSQLTERTIIGL